MEKIAITFKNSASKCLIQYIFKLDNNIIFKDSIPFLELNTTYEEVKNINITQEEFEKKYYNYNKKFIDCNIDNFLINFLNSKDLNSFMESIPNSYIINNLVNSCNFKEIQMDIKNAILFIYQEGFKFNRDLNIHRFFWYFGTHLNSKKYTDNITLLPNKNIQFFKTSEKIVNNLKFSFSYDIFIIDSFESLCFLSLKKYIENMDKPIIQCKLCHNFFIPNFRLKTLFCDNIYKDTNKTCKQLASRELKLSKMNSDELYKKYLLLRKKMQARATRHSEFKQKYDKWVKEAKATYEEYKNNEISQEEFQKWIDENNKL